ESPNDSAHRPRAGDARRATAARSRGSVQPAWFGQRYRITLASIFTASWFESRAPRGDAIEAMPGLNRVCVGKLDQNRRDLRGATHIHPVDEHRSSISGRQHAKARARDVGEGEFEGAV